MSVRTAEVHWIGDFNDGEGTVVSSGTGALNDLAVSWRSRVDDVEGQTSPEELLAAAHAACFAMQFTHGLVGAGAYPEEMTVTAKVHFEPGVGITDSALTARVTVSGLSDDKIIETAERAKLGCPVSRALAGVDVTLDLPDFAPEPEEQVGETAPAGTGEPE
jgi:osmotically inducible protein OsmC